MIYTKTATRGADGKTYAFGRKDHLDGQPMSLGGYVVFVLSSNHDSKVRGGLRKTWLAVEQDLSYRDAVKLMNKRLKFEGFKLS